MLDVGILKCVRDWFGSWVFADLDEAVRSLDCRALAAPGFATDKAVRDKALEFLRVLDVQVAGFEVRGGVDGSGKQVVEDIKFLHRENGSGKEVAVDLSCESAGTVRLFALYGKLRTVLLNGGVLFFDELDNSLHPLVVRAILVGFLNPEMNPNHVQIVCATHDTWQLENDILCRDEIWFVDKDEEGCSSLYALSDFVCAEGEMTDKSGSRAKSYLVGKYHGVPVFDCFNLVTD